MQDISLHITDIIENSIRAGAENIWIDVELIIMRNKLKIKIRDDGHGMDSETLLKAQDPFFTTKNGRSRKVGLGIPLFRQNAEHCNGRFRMKSDPGKGTTLAAEFQYDHVDRMPLGNLRDTFLTAIVGHPEVDFNLSLQREYLGGKVLKYDFSTKPLKKELDEIPLNYPSVIEYIGKILDKEIKRINLEES